MHVQKMLSSVRDFATAVSDRLALRIMLIFVR